MKTIYTLVKDIYSVVEGNGGWDETVHQYFLERSDATLRGRVMAEKEERPNTLRMSNIGKPCARALWYHVNNDGLTHSPEALPAKAQLKFLYGDILEDLLLALAKAAGHRVEGEQDVMRVGDIVGHRDCVIDGVLIDVKSASTWSFKNKFACNGLKDGPEADGFGYIPTAKLIPPCI